MLFNSKWLLQYVSFCSSHLFFSLFEEEWFLMLIQVPHTFFYIYMQNFYIFGKFTSGIYEALELRDGGSDYLGKGVLKVSWPAIFSIQWVYYVIRICYVPWSFMRAMVLVNKLLIIETNMYLHRVFAIKLISEAHLKYFQRKSNQISKCYLVGCELKFVSTVDLYQW